MLCREDVEDSEKFALEAEQMAGESDRIILVTSLLQRANAAFLSGNEASLDNMLRRLRQRSTSGDLLNSLSVTMGAMLAVWRGRITDAREAVRPRLAPHSFTYAFDYEHWRALYALLCIADGDDSEARSTLQQKGAALAEIPAAWALARRQEQRARLLRAIAEILVGRHTNAERLLRSVEPSDDSTRALRHVAFVVSSMATSEDRDELNEALEHLELAGSGGLRKFLTVVLDRCRDRLRPTAHDPAITEAERLVLQALARGESPKEIAHQTGRSVHTVRTLAQRAAEKLGCSGRQQTIAAARRLRIIPE
jgi:DNA-binding CsgD family transcriptional regulator